MDKIILRYKRNRIILTLVLLVFWLFVSVATGYQLSRNPLSFTVWLWFGVGLFYIANYSFTLYKQYATIKGNWLYKNELPFKKINLKELTNVKTFAGDYTLKTKESELLINTQIMEESSGKKFEEIIDQHFSKKV